jgi:hypothetical protein
MSNLFEITIKGKTIKTVDDFDALSLSKQENEIIFSELIKFMNHLDNLPEIKNHTTKILKPENEYLKRKIQGILFKMGMNEIELEFHRRNMAVVASDYLINPNPIEIHGTQKGRGVDFVVSLMNILVIKSGTKYKNIYLKEAINPKDGGPKVKLIEATDSFNNLLYKIQKGGHHLMMINRSVAVNIYHYSLKEKGIFKLINAPSDFDEEMICIPTDKTFDAYLYNKFLLEIDSLSKRRLSDILINDEKIAEIRRYQNSLLVP